MTAKYEPDLSLQLSLKTLNAVQVSCISCLASAW